MKYIFTVYLILWCQLFLFCQPGVLDKTFNTTGHVITHIEGYEIYTSELLLQQDGKILVCGTGTTTTNGRDFVVARYTTDGKLDSTFNESGFRVIDFFGKNDDCYAMALSSDDKILITGIVTTLAPEREMGIIRLLDDGSFDETFGSHGILVNDQDSYNDYPRAIICLDDGSFIVGGSIQMNASTPLCAVFKFKEDGSPDSTFGVNGLSTLSVGENYNPSLGIMQDDGKLITGGFLLGEPSEGVLIRFSPQGMIDSAFGTNGIARIFYDKEDHLVYSIAMQDDQKLLMVVGLTRSGQRDFCMVRYTEDGQVDSTFGVNGRVITEMVTGSNTAHAVAVQEDQKILLAGFLGTTPNHDFAMSRYMPDGSLDAGFGNGGKVVTNFGEDDLAFTMAIQPDHKIVLAGHSIDDALNSDFIVARYLSGLEVVGTAEPEPEISNMILYPNPAVRKAVLKYNLLNAQPMTISLYDLSGKRVQTFLENLPKDVGRNEDHLIFNPRLLPGQYILVFETIHSSYGMPIVLE